MLNFFQNYWTLIWVLGGYILLHLGAWWGQYRQGRYVLEHYPDRYQKQLTSSASSYPFPFSLPGGRYTSPIRNLYKIVEIANIENDAKLARSTQILKYLYYFFGVIFLAFLLYSLVRK